MILWISSELFSPYPHNFWYGTQSLNWLLEGAKSFLKNSPPYIFGSDSQYWMAHRLGECQPCKLHNAGGQHVDQIYTATFSQKNPVRFWGQWVMVLKMMRPHSFNWYLAAPRPILGHYWRGSLKGTRSLLTRLGP